jgi:hypothetical protein
VLSAPVAFGKVYIEGSKPKPAATRFISSFLETHTDRFRAIADHNHKAGNNSETMVAAFSFRKSDLKAAAIIRRVFWYRFRETCLTSFR